MKGEKTAPEKDTLLKAGWRSATGSLLVSYYMINAKDDSKKRKLMDAKNIGLYSVLPYYNVMNIFQFLLHTYTYPGLGLGKEGACSWAVQQFYGRFKRDRTRTAWLFYVNVKYLDRPSPKDVEFIPIGAQSVEVYVNNQMYNKIWKLGSSTIRKPHRYLRDLVFIRIPEIEDRVFSKNVDWKEHDKGRRYLLKNIREIQIKGAPLITGKEWIQLSNISVCIFTNLQRMTQHFFKSQQLDKLTLLMVENCPLLTLNDVFYSDKKNFTRSIEYCDLENLKKLTVPFFIRHECPNLQYLNITRCENFEDHPSRKMSKLLKLTLIGTPKLSDVFTKSLMCHNLQRLFLKNIPSMTGRMWPTMKELRVIILRKLDNFRDQFFDIWEVRELNVDINLKFQHSFNKLSLLIIRNCPRIYGTEWVPMNSLKRIDLRMLYNFEDGFFKAMKFERLTSLTIASCIKIIGKDWNDMPSLRILHLDSLPEFKESFFDEPTNTINLTEVKLKSLQDISGRGWGAVPNLKIFEIVDCKNFEDDDFFRHQRFMGVSFRKLKILKFKHLPKSSAKLVSVSRMKRLKKVILWNIGKMDYFSTIKNVGTLNDLKIWSPKNPTLKFEKGWKGERGEWDEEEEEEEEDDG
ncbi:MAG: hypothetical protein ACTSUE_10445 [Promethearchaeota archaeon]